MVDIDEKEIQTIIQRVRERMAGGLPPPQPKTAPAPSQARRRTLAGLPDHGDGIFPDIDAAVTAAQTAFQQYRDMGLEGRHTIIDAIRRSMREHAQHLARLAHDETGLGRWPDKIAKNLLVTNKTPGPEDLEPTVWTGDAGTTITEYAPWGVIASITPTTNPTSTVINNTISILSAGNAAVFNVHPNAKRVSVENVQLINQAIAAAGGPPNLVTAIAEPTIESAQQLMRHPNVPVLLVTGGPAVVREALATDKRAITAGPGNPPVVVDETADIEQAGRDIVFGASFDNNIICTDEKEAFVVAGVADELKRAMCRHGAVELREYQLRQVERVIFDEMGPPRKPGVIDKRWIGQNAGKILNEIGVQAGDEARLILVEVPVEHNLVWTEQMLPVFPLVRVRSVNEAIDLAVKAEHRFRHTASIFSKNVQTITRMARAMNCSIFVANGPTLAGLGEGGEGFTSYSIASPTGEGLTRPRHFSRIRRIAMVGDLRIV